MKNDGAATGSIGCACYNNSAGEKVFLGWYSPWLGSNYFGVEVLPPGSFPEDLYKMTYQSTNTRTCDPAGVSIKANGHLEENNATIEVLYKITNNIDHDASEASKDDNDSQIPIQDTNDATTNKLHVINFNIWGMPGGLGGCKYKQERMEALADMIKSRKPYFDLMMLTELWMQADHQLLEDAAKNVGLYMTGFRQLARKICDGRVLITNCSGLAIISAYPLKEVEFHQYTEKGSIWDGEAFAGKGVGRVRIEPGPNTKVDVFVTHLIAESTEKLKKHNNYFRIKQAEELVESYLKKSTADAIILGGDFNAPPNSEPGTPYYIIQQYMKNACEELFGQMEQWLHPKFATYGNQRNSFSNTYDPVTLDYIFHAGKSPGTITWANRFELPILHTNITEAKKEVVIPLSDHEPVISTIYVKKN